MAWKGKTAFKEGGYLSLPAHCFQSGRLHIFSLGYQLHTAEAQLFGTRVSWDVTPLYEEMIFV